VLTQPRLISCLAAIAVTMTARLPHAGGADARADAGAAAAVVAADAHRQVVVARVGPRAVSAGELEDRLARIPRYQLRTFGLTAPEVRRGFFDKVILREVLLALGAEERHLTREIEVEQTLDRTLSSATLRALIESIGPGNAISADEIQRYYDANRARYDAKERIGIWRILCPTRDEALAVIAEAKKDGSVPEFTKLAREHSTDKATNLRGGNLGFVAEGGASSEPGLLVDPAVFKAAQAVKDGELVPLPVAEGTSFSVVWRRGTQAAIHRSLDDVKVQIQDAVLRQKREAAQKALLDRLRAEKVTQLDESLLGSFDVSIDDGKIRGRKKGRNTPSQ
jgi:peptidyl-prolyl cis-trans isomerase C